MTAAARPRESAPAERTVDADEVARFDALAARWWRADGPMRALHRLNPTRVRFVRERVAARLGRDPEAEAPLAGLDLIDVGCGAGLLAEPMARLGARVTGLDAAAENIRVAAAHAEAGGLDIDYRRTDVETLAREGARYDVVLTMEVVEHVADLGAFLDACCALLRPGGAMFLATLNRTPQSFALAIVGAEYLLRWLPRGTHDWRRFVRPGELAAHLRRGGVSLRELVGVRYSPLADDWSTSDDLSVNYMAMGEKPAA